MIAAELPLSDQMSQAWHQLASWATDHSARISLSLIMAALIVALLLGLKWIGNKLDRPEDRGIRWRSVIGRTLADMRLWFMISAAAEIVSLYSTAPAFLGDIIRTAFVVTATLQAGLFLRRLILGAVSVRAKEPDTQGNLESAMGLIRLLVTVALMIISAIVILANLGVNVTGLLAGLGIGGIAIGLAAQGIFSDLFAALSILFDKPFRKGDLIRFDQTIGEVEYIGLKSSRIRALSGEEIIISNANLLDKELRNFARLEKRRINQILSLVYHTPLDKCEGLEAILTPAIDAIEGAQFQRVGLENFGTSSLDFMLVYDITASDQADVLARKNAVNLAVLRTLGEAGMQFAFPSQTTYTAAPDGSLVMPYAPWPTGAPAKKR